MSRSSDKIADNVSYLMHLFGYKPAQMAKHTGVSPRMIAYIISKERAPSIEITEQIAKSFGLNGWQLMVSSLPEDIETMKTLGKLVDDYLESSPEGKSLISMIAERESSHKTTNSN